MRQGGKLTLGPILFNWPAAERRDFYLRIADEAPVDTVHLGEVVCSKRTPFFASCLPQVADRLKRAGKEIVYSSLALVTTKQERRDLRALVSEGWLIEANDLGCAALLGGRRHVIGPYVNVYNEATLRYLVGRGAVRIALPFELPLTSIEALAANADGAELEVSVFGRTPLAISARCYHARAHGLQKNNCQYVCEAERDGMIVETVDGTSFLAVNGPQTLSYTLGNLVGELDRLVETGVHRFRLSPHRIDMVAAAAAVRAAIEGDCSAEEANRRLSEIAPFAPFANGFHHGMPGCAFAPAGSGAAEHP